MAKYLFVYHGGGMPETEAEQAQEMAAWGAWFETMGAAVVNGGNPVGKSTTVHTDRVEDNGGANPVSGFSMVEAGSTEAAVKLAQGCPILKRGGSIEVAEAMEM